MSAGAGHDGQDAKDSDRAHTDSDRSGGDIDGWLSSRARSGHGGPIVVRGRGKGPQRRDEALAPVDEEAGTEGVGGQRNPGREEILGQGDHGGSGRSG